MVHGGIRIYRSKYNATRTIWVRGHFLFEDMPRTDRSYQEEISC